MSLYSLLAEVLFVGHSLIGPNLPPLVEGALERLRGPSVVQAQIINGASLAYNWDHSAKAEGVDARAQLAEGLTRALVLTESQPIADQMTAGTTIPALADFAHAAMAANPDTQIFLYESWPAFGGDAASWRAAIAADLPLWQTAVAGAVAETGVPIGLIPAGQAMSLLSEQIELGAVPDVTTIRDFLSDDIHLSGKGLYFVALVHAAALTGQSPEGLPPKLTRTWLTRDSAIGADLAAALQRIAGQAVTAPLPPLAVLPEQATKADWPDVTEGAAPPLPEGLTPIGNPNLGFGLAGVNDWSVQLPFLNLMKSARPWTAHKPGQYGGWEEPDLRALGLLDAQGWPLGLPEGATGLSTLVLTDLPEDAGGAAGRYLVTWTGQGEIAFEGRAQVVDQKPFSAVFDYTPGEGAVVITLRALHPTDSVRDIVIVRQDRAALLASSEIFNPDFLSRLQGARLLRFMDWQATNNSLLANASDRPLPTDRTYASPKGVPMEVQIALANRLQADPWFNVPHLASDDLIIDLARLSLETLDPALTAHVEFSNEVWNWQFDQSRWAEEQGKLRWGQDGTWLQFYGLRAAEMARIWRGNYGADAPGRLTTIIATQTGVKGAESQILDAPLAQEEGLPAPVQAFDAYAVTGYFAALLGSEAKAPMLRDWLAQSAAADPAAPYALAIRNAAAELQSGALSGDPEDTLATLLGDVLPYQASVAADRGLRLMMYEGGSHVVGYGPMVDDPALTDFFTVLNYSPEMGALYGQLLAGWSMLSDAPFNAFVDVYRPGKWGSWGALRHLGDDNPRWRALAAGCRAC